MLPIVASLLSNGLSLLGNAVLAKGKDWVEAKTGVDLTRESLSQEDLTKLRIAEMEHEEELLRIKQNDDRISLEFERMKLDNVKDARSMQVTALSQNDWLAKNFVYLFIAIWSVAAMVFIGAITFGDVPENNQRFADTILGFVLATVLGGIFQYLLGTTPQSKAKDSTIQNLAEKAL